MVLIDEHISQGIRPAKQFSILVQHITMAEVVGTAVGIAGLAGVFQSLLQIYKDILTARDFPDDYKTIQLQLLLLENCTTMWGLATGIIVDEAGTPSALDQKWLVAKPTKQQRKLAEAAIIHVTLLLGAAKKRLSEYTVAESTDTIQQEPKVTVHNEIVSTPTMKEDKRKARKRDKVIGKFNRILHREHDQNHPGTMKRTLWTLVDKEELKEDVEDISNLVNRLITDFTPMDEQAHLAYFNQIFDDLKLDTEEIQTISSDATDNLTKRAVEMKIEAQRSGRTFGKITLSGNSMQSVGDTVGEGYNGGFLPQSNDWYGEVNISGNAVGFYGNSYGMGESSIDKALRHRQDVLAADKDATPTSG